MTPTCIKATKTVFRTLAIVQICLPELLFPRPASQSGKPPAAGLSAPSPCARESSMMAGKIRYSPFRRLFFRDRPAKEIRYPQPCLTNKSEAANRRFHIAGK